MQQFRIVKLEHIFHTVYKCFRRCVVSGIPQLWAALYFLSCILMLLTSQLTHLRLIELSLTDAYPNLKPYREYVLLMVCSLSFFIGILMISEVS